MEKGLQQPKLEEGRGRKYDTLRAALAAAYMLGVISSPAAIAKEISSPTSHEHVVASENERKKPSDENSTLSEQTLEELRYIIELSKDTFLHAGALLIFETIIIPVALGSLYVFRLKRRQYLKSVLVSFTVADTVYPGYALNKLTIFTISPDKFWGEFLSREIEKILKRHEKRVMAE